MYWKTQYKKWLTIVAQEELVLIGPEHPHWLTAVAPLGEIRMAGVIERRDSHTVETKGSLAESHTAGNGGQLTH